MREHFSFPQEEAKQLRAQFGQLQQEEKARWEERIAALQEQSIAKETPIFPKRADSRMSWDTPERDHDILFRAG